MKLTIKVLTVFAITVISCGVMAATVSYYPEEGRGAKDNGGAYLAFGNLVELRWAGPDNAIGGVDDQVIDQATIGLGFKTNGEWFRTGAQIASPAGDEGSLLYVRVYNAADAISATETSEFGSGEALSAIPAQVPPTPLTIFANDLVTGPIPEPSFMLVSGLAMLLLRKKK